MAALEVNVFYLVERSIIPTITLKNVIGVHYINENILSADRNLMKNNGQFSRRCITAKIDRTQCYFLSVVFGLEEADFLAWLTDGGIFTGFLTILCLIGVALLPLPLCRL